MKTKTNTIKAPPRIVLTLVSTEDSQPEIHATFDDGTTKKLFHYHPEAFRGITPAHFQGLTEAEAHSFKSRTDAAYLQGGVS